MHIDVHEHTQVDTGTHKHTRVKTATHSGTQVSIGRQADHRHNTAPTAGAPLSLCNSDSERRQLTSAAARVTQTEIEISVSYAL
jgi:hypothetical protein